MKLRTLFTARLCALYCLTALAFFGAGPRAEAQRSRGGDSRQIINGTMVGVGGRFGGRTLPFRLIVNSYTAPGEAQRLNSALQAGGQDNLLRELSSLDAGRIQLGNNVGVPANAIIATPQAEGGTRIVVFFERNVNFFELRYGTRSADYRVGYAELFLDARGRGEGTLIPAARVRLRDGNTWEVEDFGAFPARLMGLRSSGSVPLR